MNSVLIPNTIFHHIDTARALDLERRGEIERGIGVGHELLSYEHETQFGLLNITAEEADILLCYTPENFIGIALGLRADKPVNEPQLTAVRKGHIQGSHAAETAAETQAEAKKRALRELRDYPGRSPDSNFFWVVHNEVHRLLEDNKFETRESIAASEQLEGFIGYAVGVRTFVRAHEERAA